MVRLEGLISKKVVRRWLEHYESLVTGDRPLDYIGTNSGAKSYDGITNSQLNKVMLEAAFKDMPIGLWLCTKYRWVDRKPLGETLARLKTWGVCASKSSYYRRCDLAITYIYYHVNGRAANIKDLLDKLEKIS